MKHYNPVCIFNRPNLSYKEPDNLKFEIFLNLFFYIYCYSLKSLDSSFYKKKNYYHNLHNLDLRI